MKINFKENFKTLGKSIYNTKALFETRKNTCIVPILILILSVFMMCVPNYLLSKNANQDDIVNGLPGIRKPIETILTSDLDCSVKNSSLLCNINQAPLNQLVEDEGIKYTVVVNETTLTGTDVSKETEKDTDNLVVLYESSIYIRYTERDKVNKDVETYIIVGDYSDLEGYNFKEVSANLNSNPDKTDTVVGDFIENVYKSTLDTQLYVNAVSSVLSFSLFVLITSLMLKSPTLFKRKKGFKFTECLKISLTSSLPAFLISLIAYFLLGIEFGSILGIIYLIRIVYVYFKYIFLNKNNIFVQLYEETKDERFKLV